MVSSSSYGQVRSPTQLWMWTNSDVFLDSFLLAAVRQVTPFTTFLFMFSRPLLLLSSFLAPSSSLTMSSPFSAIGLNNPVLSAEPDPNLSKSSLTVVRQLFCETFLVAAGDLDLGTPLSTIATSKRF